MNDITSAIRLIRSENIGPRSYFAALKKFGSVIKAIEGLGDRPICSVEVAEAEIAAVEKLGAKILLHSDADYPDALLDTYDAPPVLFYFGDLELLKRKCVGIVGTRNLSANGGAITRKIAAGLGEAGVVVVSGLAKGIDTEAHKASLATGTVAVVAGGLDEIYPPENKKLFAEIAEKGLIISETPPGVRALARHFPQRNRIIAGLSQGVLVVEAAKKSGSMITANYARREGRVLFAVPGSPLDSRSSGTNYLIKNGAVLTESCEDILGNLDVVVPRLYEEISDYDSVGEEAQNLREKIIAALSYSPVSVDEIIQQVGASAAVVSGILLELEIAGQVNRQYGNKVTLVA